MATMNTTAPVIALDTPAALDAARVGRKAANLAAARAAGLPVAPGVVLTADWASDDQATALQVWRIISHDGARPLVVRPSGKSRGSRPAPGSRAIEMGTVVSDGEGLLRAIAALRAADACVPVLVQPHVAGDWQGVLFADDAGGGWRARPVVIAAPAGGPAWTAEIDHAGRVRDVVSASTAAPPLPLLGRLARLADKVAAAFDGPHDLEWAVATDGRLQLLQVRPVAGLHVAAGSRSAARRPAAALVGSAA
jgi:pyruvate,water dikinase